VRAVICHEFGLYETMKVEAASGGNVLFCLGRNQTDIR